MKIVFLFLTFFSFKITAADYGEDLKEHIGDLEIPIANPLQTEIIEQTNNYVILFNPTLFSINTLRAQALIFARTLTMIIKVLLDMVFI